MTLEHGHAFARAASLLAAAATLAFAAAVAAGEAPDPRGRSSDAAQESQPLKDAFIKGRIVSALAVNPHVSAFDLHVDVERGVVRLSGAVDSGLERDLALEIARGVDGVRDVRSDVAVRPGARKDREREKERRTVGQTVDDAATTTAIKSKLIANRNLSASRINVTTRNGIVTLTGTVGTEAEKDLAGRIAENHSAESEVRNELATNELATAD